MTRKEMPTALCEMSLGLLMNRGCAILRALRATRRRPTMLGGATGVGKYPVVLVTDEYGEDAVIYAVYVDGCIFGSRETKQDVIDGCLGGWSLRDDATGRWVRVEDTPFCLARLPYPGRPYSLLVKVDGELCQWVSLDFCAHWEPWARYRERLIEGHGELPEECAD